MESGGVCTLFILWMIAPPFKHHNWEKPLLILYFLNKTTYGAYCLVSVSLRSFETATIPIIPDFEINGKQFIYLQLSFGIESFNLLNDSSDSFCRSSITLTSYKNIHSTDIQGCLRAWVAVYLRFGFTSNRCLIKSFATPISEKYESVTWIAYFIPIRRWEFILSFHNLFEKYWSIFIIKWRKST